MSILMMTIIIYTGVRFLQPNNHKNNSKHSITTVPTKVLAQNAALKPLLDPASETFSEQSPMHFADAKAGASAVKVTQVNANLTQTLTLASDISKKAVAKVNTKKAKENTNAPVITSMSIKKTTSKYSKMAVSIANSYVNIRKKASTDSEIIGKLHKNAVAKIIKKKKDWYYVSSGTIKGYVKADYLKTGIDDKTFIKKYGTRTATVNTDGLNVRDKADIDTKRVDVVYSGERYEVLKEKGDWVKIDVADDNVAGYVKKDYVKLKVTFDEAISIEEERLLRQLEEEKENALKQTTAPLKTSSTKKSNQKNNNQKRTIKTVYGKSTSYSNEELKLLSCLVHAEAGNQCYEGKLAVANVVLNRVKSRKYPNSIYKVIYQKSQFSVASSGSLKKQLNSYKNYNSNSQRLTIKAAKAALEGGNNIGNCLYFNRYSSSLKARKNNSVKIQDHLFW